MKRTRRVVAGRRAFTLIELLVVMSIILVLTGLLAGGAFALQNMGRVKAAKVDIESIGVGLAAYNRDFGVYPPDTDTRFAGGLVGSNECLVYYLGRRLRKGLNTYGPYVEFKEAKLQDSNNNGYDEYKDPFTTPYYYAENRSDPSNTSTHNPRGYDLVSAGPDGELGGGMSPSTGYVDAGSGDVQGLKGQADNISNWKN